MRTGRTLVLALVVLMALSAFAATWEGTAVVGGSGDFPDAGLTAACNSFPKDSTIELRNLENGKLVRVTISGGLDNPGVFIVLSPQAAAELGMKAGISSRIRASLIPNASFPSPDAATASRSNDPDFNPSLLASVDGTATSTPSTGGETPATPAPDSGTATAPDTGSTVEAPPASDSTSTAPVFEPEKAKVIGDRNPSPPAEQPAAPATLPEAQPDNLAPTDKAEIVTKSEPAPAAAAPPSTLADARQPSLPPTEKGDLVGAETPSPPTSAGKDAAPVELAQAAAPEIPASDKAVIVGGDQPPAPAETAPAPGLAEASAPQMTDTGGPALVGGGGPVAPESPTTVAPLADATAPDLPQAENPALVGGEEPQAEPSSPPSIAMADAEPPAQEAGGGEQVLSLEPSAPKPPESIPPAVAAPPQTQDAAPPPTESPATPEPTESAPTVAAVSDRQPALLESLEKGAYYVQIGVFGSEVGISDAVRSFDVSWPLAEQKVPGAKGDQYRLFIGPVARDESGLFILKLKAMGYRDAFIRRGQ